MRLLNTLRLLFLFVSRPIQGRTHAERLESFYHYQADAYDEFRKTFLRGRDELGSRLPFSPGSRWCDLGCGTGYMLEATAPKSRVCESIHLVDLCPSLLKVAQRKVSEQSWKNAITTVGDLTQFQPDGLVDLITFSYSLSMTPNWFAAIDQALRALLPGGHIGVVDFYVSRKWPSSDSHVRHSFFTRHFWPAWFDLDNVHPSPDHVAYLQRRFDVQYFYESRTKVPGMPWLRPPYYIFIGKTR